MLEDWLPVESIPPEFDKQYACFVKSAIGGAYKLQFLSYDMAGFWKDDHGEPVQGVVFWKLVKCPVYLPKQDKKLYLDWQYSVDSPIPLDGNLRTVAYYEPQLNACFVYEKYCTKELVPGIDDPEKYYAWTDVTISPPRLR